MRVYKVADLMYTTLECSTRKCLDPTVISSTSVLTFHSLYFSITWSMYTTSTPILFPINYTHTPECLLGCRCNFTAVNHYLGDHLNQGKVKITVQTNTNTAIIIIKPLVLPWVALIAVIIFLVIYITLINGRVYKTHIVWSINNHSQNMTGCNNGIN